MRQGSGGRRPRGRPNRKQHGNAPRSSTFDSNGPEGRIRGNAHQVYEKYLGLARDAASSGDRVAAESFFQHAEHYFRILNDSTDPTPAEFNGEPRQRGEQQAGQQGRGPNGPAAPRVNGSGPQPDVEFPIDVPAGAQGGSASGNGRDESAESGQTRQAGGDGNAERGDGRGGGPRQRRRSRPQRAAADDEQSEGGAPRRSAQEADEEPSDTDDGKTASV